MKWVLVCGQADCVGVLSRSRQPLNILRVQSIEKRKDECTQDKSRQMQAQLHEQRQTQIHAAQSVLCDCKSAAGTLGCVFAGSSTKLCFWMLYMCA